LALSLMYDSSHFANGEVSVDVFMRNLAQIQKSSFQTFLSRQAIGFPPERS
jgi:hypothetical protein